ncbi:MAG: phosphate ABC transporter substrate-binding protein [Nitrososphaerota archaeon]|nr:phosphate ABC transporter substrate-binding protein [Candidatus Bathyarchaeota archaeon]MDW8022886.1 phosphate ABC transporter substrate-binding protein [Nitrososphaerota archaeon]
MIGKASKGISKLVAVLGMISLLIIGLAAGYYMGATTQEKSNTSNSQGFEEDSAWRTSSITLSGSTTVLPIANACAVTLMNKYPGIAITVQGGGSGVGYSQVIDGVIDIGMASRDPKTTEIDKAKSKGVDLWLHPIALDAVCVVVHPSVANESYPLKLTLQEVGKIFAGTYTYWDEVKPGLPHKEIVIFVREPGSGTRGTFEEYTMHPWNYNVTVHASVQPSNPAVKSKVETTPYSIGYISFGFISEKMHVVALAKEDGKPYVYPTLNSIAKGEYPISRYLYLVTNGQPKSGSLADRFIDFARSKEGQKIAEDCGYLKLPHLYPTS